MYLVLSQTLTYFFHICAGSFISTRVPIAMRSVMAVVKPVTVSHPEYYIYVDTITDSVKTAPI